MSTGDRDTIGSAFAGRDWRRIRSAAAGIGRALLHARIARVWALDVSQIRVRTSQHSAGFFQRAGFEVVDVRTNGFAPGIDQVTMLLRRST